MKTYSYEEISAFCPQEDNATPRAFYEGRKYTPLFFGEILPSEMQTLFSKGPPKPNSMLREIVWAAISTDQQKLASACFCLWIWVPKLAPQAVSFGAQSR